MKDASPWSIAFFCAAISLLAFGGADAAVPEMHRQLVNVGHWFGEAEFVRMYAIARVSPGPNVMLMSLSGLRLGGWLGCLMATLGVCAPSGVLILYLAKKWHHFEGTYAHRVFKTGLAPVTVGLTAATAWIMTQAAATSLPLLIIAMAATAVAWKTRWSPIWVVLAAGMVGAVVGL